MSLKVGDKVVITGGRDKVGKIGIVTGIGGEGCRDEDYPSAVAIADK